jgi:hypothetical protein
MSDESVILINLLKAKPGKQEALFALLKQNTDPKSARKENRDGSNDRDLQTAG